MPFRQDTVFDGPMVEEKTVWNFKSLGRLNIVTIKSVSEFSSSPPEDHRPRTSPVLRLDLGRSILAADFVRELLTCPRALKKLPCSASWFDHSSPLDNSSTESPEHRLEPTRHSLTELVLAPYFDQWNLPQIDLSQVGSLRVLELGSCCSSYAS